MFLKDTVVLIYENNVPTACWIESQQSRITNISEALSQTNWKNN